MTLQRVIPRRIADPWADMRSLQEQINQLFDFDTPWVPGIFDRSVSPAVDMTENDQAVEILVEIPGIELKELDLSITGNVITIKGEKKLDRKAKDAGSVRQEIWEGSFQRTLSLPDSVDSSKAEAELKDGILKVMVPKREDAKPKQISVKIQ